MDERTVGLVIIGDEVLRGQVEDKNTSYLAKRLSDNGLKLRKVVTIPDVVDEIAEEVKLASVKYSVVFTAGGVGPTHDDVTYLAIAKALGLKIEENRELLSIYAELFPGQVEARRLARVPTPCEIIHVPSPDFTRTYAVIKTGNVYVLPGSPFHFSEAVNTIVPRLGGGSPSHSEFLDINLTELEFVKELDDFAKRWEGRVTVGSYPQRGSTPLTRISLEGNDMGNVKTARKDLQALIIPREIDSARVFTLSHAYAVKSGGDEQPHVKIALDILTRCYKEYVGGIFMNFNGGKDCTAVLHLWATVLKLNGSSPPLCLYVSEDPFSEVEEFVDHAEKYYDLELVRKSGSIRSALQSLITERNHLTIGIMGMRRGDPGSDKLEPFATTDNGWPAMIRVNPILDWSYAQVWEFLLEHKVPYCSLYDQGYTSLGAKATTKRNPLLKDASNPTQYLPAHTLSDGSVERQGRG